MSRYIALWKRHARKAGSKKHEDELTEEAIAWFEEEWAKGGRDLMLIPGKDALTALNQEVQNTCSVSIASSGIISAMTPEEVPAEMRGLVEAIGNFAGA